MAADEEETPEALYRKALEEDVLIVYTVSTRVAPVKESFEKAYPGLSVEIRDLRSPNLIEEVEANDKNSVSSCDVVLCNDNSGDFKTRLVDTGIVVPYLPSDIAAHMKTGMTGEMVSFFNEAELLFYSSAKYEKCPIGNLWELTDPIYRGRVFMPNPLRSFSTWALCGASLDHADELREAYREYTGEDLAEDNGENAAEIFWRRLSENLVFTNSSDEVVEALSSGNADFGFCVSSKLRFRDIGYEIEPVWKLAPFTGCRTTYAVMMARNARNVHAAKLFIRYMLGETDGSGEGYKPFCTVGTWSARDDVPDGSPVPLDEIDLITPDQDRLIAGKKRIETFWTGIMKESTVTGK
ncbi:MAG: extracellular solute-binding protein [Lachnospiraceae bacterium]|nr:extracellular solute-binding protein [Lachnospiraceae bacterium]